MLVIRVWLEEGGLRARITHTLDAAGSETVTAAAASEPEILEAVRGFLRSFEAPSAAPR